MTLYPKNNDAFALDSFLAAWGERNRLLPAEAEAIRYAITQTAPDATPALDYAWWAKLYKTSLPNNAQMFRQIAETRRRSAQSLHGWDTYNRR